MRIAAHITGCTRLITLFNEGRDIHTENAATVTGVPIDEVPVTTRYAMKRAGFGVLYGMEANGLATTLNEEGIPGWDVPRCAAFIADYYKLHPEIKEFQQETVAFARRHGYVKDMFGRRRWIPELIVPVPSVQSAGKRQAMNMPVQAGAQGIIKLAAIYIWNRYKDMWDSENLVHWLLQEHDELIWEVVDSRVEEVADTFAAEMENVLALAVPTPVDQAIGDNWAEL